MKATPPPPVLDRLLDPLSRILTPEVAERVVRLRFDKRERDQIDKLARKCNEGRLTETEQSEYETYVNAIDFIAILQAKARAILQNKKAPHNPFVESSKHPRHMRRPGGGD